MTKRLAAAFTALWMWACVPLGEGDVQTVTVLQVDGLFSNQAELSQVPKGAMREADNVVFRRPGICETRPGRELVPGAYSEASTLRQLTTFRGYLIGWFANNKLARHNGSAWTSYSGTYTPPFSLPRVRFMTSGETLYVTTSLGVYRLDDPVGEWKLSGVQGAIQSTAATTGASGFLPNNKSVAYRTHWGRIDANDVLLRGPPSGRLIVDNTAGGTRNILLTTYIPTTIDTTHFLQIHRTADVDVGVDPGEEMAQVAEVFPTPTDITNRSLTYTDTTPDELRGPSLYTATEQGAAAEQRPPITADLVEYNGYTIFSRTQGLQTFTVTLLGAGAAPGLVTGEGIAFEGTLARRYTAGPVEDVSIPQFQLFAGGTASQNVENTARSLAKIVSIDTNGEWHGEYVGDGVTFPVGTVVFRGRSLGTAQFMVRADGSTDHFVPALVAVNFGTGAGALQRAANVVTGTTAKPHGYVVGQVIEMLSNGDNVLFPLGLKTVASTPTTTTFTYSEVGANGSTASFQVKTTTTEQLSQPDGASNAYGWSPIEQPDAQPLINVDVVGTPGSATLRVLKVGSAVYFIKPEGLFRLFGSSPEDWSLEAWDETRKFLAPETAVVTGGVAYAMTTEGYVRWTENTKPEPASFNIEPTIRDLLVKAQTEVDTYGWAAVNERDRELYLALPSAAGNTSATQIFVLNWATGAWSRWPISTFIGHASSLDGRLYLSPASGAQAHRLRGAGTSADYQDTAGEAIAERVVFVPQVGGSPELEKLWTEAEVYFNGNAPSSVQLLFTSEQAAEVSVAADPEDGDRPGILRASPDIEHARCSTLTLGLTHAVAQEKMELTGYSATIKNAYRARR